MSTDFFTKNGQVIGRINKTCLLCVNNCKQSAKNTVWCPNYKKKGRSFEKDPFVKYRNPETSRDIVPFELFINWELPLVLCEGPFDAIAIKRNAIPLLGKNIQSNLKVLN